MNQVAEKGRKKVLFLITKATYGGAQRYVYDLATHLPEDQFDVSVAYGQSGRLKDMLTEKRLRTYHLSALDRDIALFSDITSFFQIIALLRQTRPDVLHLNSSKAAALGALAARIIGIQKIIFTAHGWPFKEYRNFIARSLIRFISWVTALLAHTTIVVSKHDETIGKQMILVGKKICYVPLGIEPPTFLSRDEAAAALSISTNAPRIVTIGELTKNKGHQYAISAVAKLKQRNVNIEYFVMGDGDLRGQLEVQTRDQGVFDRVHFLGFVEDAAKYLKAFDVFLLPSIKEGMPYVLLEAAQARLPLIATDVIDPDFAQSVDAILVDAGNAMILADALERAIQKGGDTISRSATLDRMISVTALLYC